jgi:adenylate cyclase
MTPSLKHELRTPLHQIFGYCEMLMEEAEDHQLGDCRADLERIHQAGRRLLAAINDLPEFGRPDARERQRSRIEQELRGPLDQIIDCAEALQATAEHKGQISFAADLCNIHAAARDLLRRLGAHFDAAAEGRSPAADAAAGGLTTFAARSGAPALAAPLTIAVPPPMTGALLVVEDDAVSRSMLARRLVRLGHKVVITENGRLALELLRSQPFDLLLLDVQMPEMDGHELLRRLKADAGLREVPVIVLSASSETDAIARCIEIGAEDYLPKPFDPVLLQARIGACLEKKRLRDREVSHLRQIEEEKRRSDELLHIILPHDVAEELKRTQGVKPRRFENVAVLFCDIADFTAYCNQHPPELVHQQLQALVDAFEQISARHGLEKIKTIGDSFMATAGLLAPLDNPALACVRAGLEMGVAAGAQPPRWQVRVGVHAGPVIAGVVGRRKYQYDVWGDTVNTAARMEEAAPPGSVCVDAGTWARIAAFCRGRAVGRVAIKGKGELELFAVEELR